MRLRIIGLAKALARFASISKFAQARADAASKEAAPEIQERARGLAPVRRGVLRDSFEIFEDARGTVVGTRVSYSVFQEFGTRFIAPVGFMRQSVEGALGFTERVFVNQFRKLVG